MTKLDTLIDIHWGILNRLWAQKQKALKKEKVQ